MTSELDVVRDDQHGHAASNALTPDQVCQADHTERVQPDRWLVEKHDTLPAGQGAGYREALSLSAGQSRYLCPWLGQFPREINRLQPLIDVETVSAVVRPMPQGYPDIVSHVQVVERCTALGHHPEPATHV